MAENTTAYHQNFTPEKKHPDIVEKDIRKWVESVVEFRSKMDKQKGDMPLEKHLKKNKKLKTKKKPSVPAQAVGNVRNGTPGQLKHVKPNKQGKKLSKSTKEKPKNETLVVDFFDALKESYRSLKLPANWTSGLSNNRVVFNRIKVTAHNAQQKMTVEKSLIITKDCNTHILINGNEITFPNWEMQKISAIDDVKKAIKDVDSLKVCEGPQNGVKSPQCSGLTDKEKICGACKSDTSSPPKAIKKKQRVTKKSSGTKETAK